MGSKRTASKKLSKAPSSLPPADSPTNENSQNPNRNPTFSSPSKSPKKPKPSAPVYTDSSLASPSSSAAGDTPSHKSERERKRKLKDTEIPAKALSGGVPCHRWTEDDTLKLLRAVDVFRSSNGTLPTASHMPGFVKQMKGFIPFSLSEKTIHGKIRHLRSKFVKSPKPGPGSSEFDLSFYELASKVWGSDSLKANDSASGAGKGNSRKDKFLKKPKVDKANVEGDGEEEGEDQAKSEVDVTGEKAEVGMDVVVIGKKIEIEDLLDNQEAGYPYKYLKHALEEFWLEKKLDMDTLFAALPKVDPVKAELLDKQLAEIYEEEINFEIEKINLTNEILLAMLDHLDGGRYGA